MRGSPDVAVEPVRHCQETLPNVHSFLLDFGVFHGNVGIRKALKAVSATQEAQLFLFFTV